MSAALTLAEPGDLERLAAMLAAAHAETGQAGDEESRRASLAPLLEGSPHGAVWLIGPRRSPVGFIAIGFGWSLDEAGLAGRLEAFWIRPGVRGRGIGGEVLGQLLPELRKTGLRSLTVALPPGASRAARLFARHRFATRDGWQTLGWPG